jgi:surface protein
MSFTSNFLTKLAEFDAINTATFYPELAKIKYLLLDSNRNNTFIYTYKSGGAGYFQKILSNLQNLFPNMFIYYNKNSAYQYLLFTSINFIPGDNYTDAINSTNTIFISQTPLLTHLTGQLIFTYTGSIGPTKEQIPFIEASGMSFNFDVETNANTKTVNVNVNYVLASIDETSNFGLSFANQNVSNFYQSNATNINITTLTNIHLSNAGSQFSGLGLIFDSITPGQNPIIRPNTSLYKCFDNCQRFNADISSWNTANVTTLYKCFYNCQRFNADISSWNTANVTDMSYCFYNCRNFNSDISSWNTANVKTLNSCFDSCVIFNSNLSNWNTSKVTNLDSCFSNCQKFNQAITYNETLNYWDTFAVTTIAYIFYGAYAFNNANTPMNWKLTNLNIQSLNPATTEGSSILNWRGNQNNTTYMSGLSPANAPTALTVDGANTAFL